jgi:bifunctional non-homologous end joining protein LigD
MSPVAVATVTNVAARNAAFVSPMLATLVKPPDHLRIARREDWQYERNRLSFNARFPGVVEALGNLPSSSFVVDGELVAFDGDQTSFSLLQSSPHPQHLTYCVFDLLFVEGHDARRLTLTERQTLLATAVEDGHAPLSLVKPLPGDPAELFDRACSSGWEGLVAKRVASSYRDGRSPDWQKLKCTAGQELVIGGWTEPTGTRVGLGALLVGYYDAGQLRYAGKVGTGFTDQLLRDLHRDLVAREVPQSPFSDPIREKRVHWARPDLVGEVTFSEWTTDGRLRHPSFQGLRPDKSAADVHREAPR